MDKIPSSPDAYVPLISIKVLTISFYYRRLQQSIVGAPVRGTKVRRVYMYILTVEMFQHEKGIH